MTRKDDYYNRAKQQDYRARSAYKLKQLDDTADLFDDGDTVVDLGAAPGGWLQVAAEKVGPQGKVVGVDLQRIDDLDAHQVSTIPGDMTEEETRDRLRRELDVAERSSAANQKSKISGDAEGGQGVVDVVVSDMAPNMTGEYELDHARSVHLARIAFETAVEFLKPGGDFVAKVFQGRDLDDLEADIEPSFQYVRRVSPDASRDSSSEVYLVAKGYTDAPVAEGDRLTVEISDTGGEGDGIARVEGFTVFVSGAEEGEEIEVSVTDVKPNFAFAERVD
ncbi:MULTISPECIES: 23S rRNA (uridine(2552)-2'-O)-methyltransferase [Halolamina]|uniref:Ribosomal RNA large subunit methyltransferase E n=1 Tax=Halolamina pelagica TaxID=699431 RepID=A0A1I5RLF4_9EURY|nr:MULTISPECIES: 23S rRNA (uridine(2552)-2'-O)-methyltransferase [Halolamina]NHX35244.1 TRAM domain-containing protein [Halolamina sp. R1-12]SFP59313.1 23S rRNA (uridine2552-2'-O)-methyltransferase [Halolamina pelagica]